MYEASGERKVDLWTKRAYNDVRTTAYLEKAITGLLVSHITALKTTYLGTLPVRLSI